MNHVKEISSAELEKMLEQEGKAVLIDVREEHEVVHGMIPGAKHIPLNQIPEATEQLNKDEEYIMVCRSGARSMRAAEYMQQSGLRVINLAGGMLEWDGEIVF